jgi:hypothetical protein
MDMGNDKDLKSLYLDLLEISEEEAEKNAAHLANYVDAIDKDGVSYSQGSMAPIVRIIEYIDNPDKTKAYEDYLAAFGTEPEWSSDTDFGLKGIMLPYLSDIPEGITPEKDYLAVASNSGFKSEEGLPAITITEIDMIRDKSKTQA